MSSTSCGVSNRCQLVGCPPAVQVLWAPFLMRREEYAWPTISYAALAWVAVCALPPSVTRSLRS